MRIYKSSRIVIRPDGREIKKSKISMDEAAFRYLQEENAGLCTACASFNFGNHEPDAEDYDCEQCGKPKSQGMDNVMMMGLIHILDDAELDEIKGTSQEISV